MDLNGIQNLGQGLIDGYKTGLQLKRQQAEDAATAEDRAYLREKRTLDGVDRERRQREHEEDRALLQQQTSEDRSRLKVTRGREDEKYTREQKELVFKDNVKGVLRKTFPLYQAGQHDAVVSTLQQAYNSDPAFNDGYLVQFAQDGNGNYVRGKDGKYAMTMADASGKAVGQPQALSAEDAMMLFANQLSPEETFKQMEADKRAKSLRQEEQVTWEKRQRFTHGLNLAEQGAKTAQEKDLAQFKQTLEDQGKTREYEVKLQYELEKRKAEKGGAELSAEDILKAEIDITKAILANDLTMKVTPKQAVERARDAVGGLTGGQPAANPAPSPERGLTPPPSAQRQPAPAAKGPRVNASHANTPNGQAFIRIYNEALRRGDTKRAQAVLARARNAGLLEH